jgi:hypothetical protein
MHVNMKPSEGIAVLAPINPAVYAAGSPPATVWVKADQFHHFAALITAGTVTASTAVAVKLQQANTSGGGGAKDVPGKALANLAPADSNKQQIINLRPEELDADSGFAWFGLVITVTGGTSAALSGAIVGVNPRLGSAAQAASVSQIVY